MVTCNLVEVSPQPDHLEFVVSAAHTWLASYADDVDFWVGNSIGRRVCAWLESIWRQDPARFGLDQPVRAAVDQLLTALVTLGVAEARHLEETLSGRT